MMRNLLRGLARGEISQLSLSTAFLLVFCLAFYLLTLQPSLAWGDGARLQIEAYTGESFLMGEFADQGVQFDPFPFSELGVAAWDHPIYVILGHTLTGLLPGLSPPWLINLLSAIFGVGTLWVLYRLALAHTASVPAALLASLSVAVSHTFWFHSVTPEVYTLFTFLMLASLYLIDRYQRKGSFLSLAGGAFLLGLGGANHLLALLAIPALVLYGLTARERLSTRPLTRAQAMKVVLAFSLGFSPYLIQLIRMLRVFAIGEALGPVIGSIFLNEITSTTPGDLLTGLLNYLVFAALQFSPLGLVLGLYGFLRGREISLDLWRKVMAFYLVYTVFGILYRVTDQFAFFMASHVFFGLAMAMGLAAALRNLAAVRRAALTAGVIAGLVLMPLFYALLPGALKARGVDDQFLGIPQVGTGVRDGLAYYLNPNKRGDLAAYQFGEGFFLQAPPGSLLIADWYADTDELFVMRYFSRVESLRPDIAIVGWALQDPFDFPSGLVTRMVAEQVGQRPVFLASLSEEFYGASKLMSRYCVQPQLGLYRVYPLSPSDAGYMGLGCLSQDAVAIDA